MDAQRGCSVLWVSGPPGSGKTTFVSSYLSTRKLPCLWYQVDEGDGDIASFFYYMGLAAKKAAPRHKRPMPLLTPEYLQGVPTFTRRYFEELFRRLKTPFAIVLDNFQDAGGAAFNGIISHGLEAVPEGINVIILSRSEPPAGLSRLRANNKMAFLGWDEISFTLKECREFLKAREDRALPEKTIRQLHDRTEGWAAGLVLMTEMAKTREIHYSLISELSREAVFNYFANEIFEKTDAETRDFLLKTSFFPSMSVTAAEELTGNDGAKQLLSRLSRNHYFTDWRPLPAPVFQYHPLFREFLQVRAKGVFDSSELIAIRRHAALILEKEGRVDEAAALFIDAGDREGLSRIILDNAQYMVAQGRHKTVEEWIHALPGGLVDGSPWLLYWLGICRMAFDPYESRPLFERAFELFKSATDDSGMFLSWACIVDTFVYAWGDFSPLDHWIAVMEEILSRRPEFPSPEIEVRVAGCMSSAMTYRQPGRADLVMWAERVQRIVVSSNDVHLQMMLGSQLIFYYLWIGDFSKITPVVEALRPSRGVAGYDLLTKQNWYAWNAMYAWFVADWTACLQAISDGLGNAEDSGIHLLDLFLLSSGVWGGLSLGDPSAAVSYLGKMALIDSRRPGDKALYHYQAASVAWYYGEYKKSAEHGKLAVKICETIGWPIATVLCAVDLAVTLFDDGRYDEADAYLAKGVAMSRGIIGLQFLVCLNSARFAFHRGKGNLGLDQLREGFALGARYGLVNMPRWNDGHMSLLCAKALEYGIEADYVRRLIRLRGLIPPILSSQLINGEQRGMAAVEDWPYPVKIYCLGNFKILKNGEPVEFAGKVQQKPLAMLKVLVALGGREVAAEQMIDALWPEAEGDTAHISFKTTLHRLRQLLGSEKAIRLQEGRITLDERYCWIDVVAFQELIEKSENGGNRDSSGTRRDPRQLRLKAINLYAGEFLPADGKEPWAIRMRERLKARAIRLFDAEGRSHEEAGAWGEAVECYEKALDANELYEEFYQRLMGCYQKQGKKAEALAVYHRCEKILESVLGIEPSRRTRDIYKEIKG